MSFDRLAPHYTWMERVLAGPRLQRCRIAWLEHLAGCERILIVGVGHGHFLRACARRFPRATITSVDASTAMLARARRRAGEHGHRLEYVHASLPQWRPEPARFDAIVTHFFLDCFEPTVLGVVVDLLAHAARPHARWLLADFTVPSRGWQRQRARLIHGMMYAFFRPVAGVGARCVTPPDDLLREHGFTLAHRLTTDWGLLQSDAWVRGEKDRA
jgi:ubiquinone/menaquinone biosynthesis C-methylase UbiE